MKSILSTVAALLVSLSTAYASPAVHECGLGNLDRIGNLVDDVKSYARGAIRVAYVSTGEPIATPDHLLIFVAVEPADEKNCYAISADAEGHGFSSVDWDNLVVTYDADGGLLISVPISSYDQDKGPVPAGRVKVRISRKGGTSGVSIEK